MNTEEAIEFIKESKPILLYARSEKDLKESFEYKECQKLDQFIDLLKRGEKFEAIVKELENLDFMSNKDKLHFNWEDFNNLMNKIKQKYFPNKLNRHRRT